MTFQIRPCDTLVATILKAFPGRVAPEDFGFVFRIYDNPPVQAPDRFNGGILYGHNGEMIFYPASVVKVFFMVAMAARIEAGEIHADTEDRRALAHMIRISSNDATQYIMDRVTGVGRGPQLPDTAMDHWWHQRTWVQRYFESWSRPEFDTIRVWHSTFEEGPYGREKMARKIHGENRLTPLAAASLMHDIAARKVLNARCSDQMMALLSRDWERDPATLDGGDDDQVRGFIVEALPPDFKVWSKAGLTSRTRHDVLYAEAPSGVAITISAFTRGKYLAGERRFLPALGHSILEHLAWR